MAKYTRTPAMETADDLAARVAFAREHAAAIGRQAPLDICYALLTARARSRQELHDALLRKGISAGVAEVVLGKFDRGGASHLIDCRLRHVVSHRPWDGGKSMWGADC